MGKRKRDGFETGVGRAVVKAMTRVKARATRESIECLGVIVSGERGMLCVLLVDGESESIEEKERKEKDEATWLLKYEAVVASAGAN